MGWCGEVGVREVGRWWKAGQGVDGVEGEARVVLCTLQVVVVDGDNTLDGLWQSVSDGLMSNGCFAESCVGGKVLMEKETMDVEVGQDSHQCMWWVESVYFGPESLVCGKVCGKGGRLC